MGRPPVKSTKALTKAKLDAEAKFKLSPLGINATLKELTVNAISKIDPIDVIGLIGLTYAIFNLIQGTQELFDAFYGGLSEIAAAPLGNPFLSFFTGFFKTIFSSWLQPEQLTEIQKDKDWLLWIESFGIAYLLLRTGSGTENLTSKVAGILGMSVVP